MAYETAGHVFSLTHDNPTVENCTVSHEVMPNAVCFSLAKGTSISAESYPVATLQFALAGASPLSYPDEPRKELHVGTGEAVVKSADKAIGVTADADAIYAEITIGENASIGDGINADEVFSLVDLVPYEDGKIVNRDIAGSKSTKFVIMSFDRAARSPSMRLLPKRSSSPSTAKASSDMRDQATRSRRARTSGSRKTACTASRLTENSKWHCCFRLNKQRSWAVQLSKSSRFKVCGGSSRFKARCANALRRVVFALQRS